MKQAWIALTLAAVVAGCGCGDDPGPEDRAAAAPEADAVSAPPGWREHPDEPRGFRVALPPGWNLAEQSLSPEMGDPVEYWFGFGDAGRAFHVFVGVGKDAPAELRREAFAILDTLRFDPEVKPDWRSAG